MNRLQGKVAIVTGGGSRGLGIGNGRATAILFAREGAKVLIVDINKEFADETLRYILEEHGEATFYQGDLTKEGACQEMAKRCLEVYGRIDILHNNIGIGSTVGNVLKISEEEIDRLVSINLKTIIFSSKVVIPIMKQQGGGSITNIASDAGLRYSPMIMYASTKAAIIHLTEVMAVEHGQDNIRVNCIAPGYIDTPAVAHLMTQEVRKQREEKTPLKRQGSGWDVAWAAVFLASDEASFISGAILTVDGGKSCL